MSLFRPLPRMVVTLWVFLHFLHFLNDYEELEANSEAGLYSFTLRMYWNYLGELILSFWKILFFFTFFYENYIFFLNPGF